MSTILPPPSTPSPLPTAIPVPVASVPNPPIALTELALGTAVRAEIVALLARGLVEVETDIGTFQLRSNLALRVGAELDLQLLKSGPQPQFVVRGVDGHPLPGQAGGTAAQGSATSAANNTASQLAQAAAQGEPGAAAGQAGGSANAAVAARPTAPLTLGATITATLLPRPTGTEASGPAPGGPLPQSGTQGAPGGIAAPPTAPTTAIVQNLTRLDAAGTRVTLRLLSVQSGAQTPTGSTPAPTAAQPGTIGGTVTAFTPSGRPIVETAAGLLSLDTDADVRIGQKLTFAVMPPQARPADASQPGFLDTFLLKRSWPTLEQAIVHLGQRVQEAAAGGGSTTATNAQLPLPQANSQLANNLLNATTALAEGDIRTWLGDLATALEQDQPDLFRRLGDEFAQLARLAAEPRQDDWRTALLPFFTGSSMEPVQMHLRGEKSPKGEKKQGEGGSRFIIDLNLSRFGRMQIDGFMKDRGNTRKSFDLIIRTAEPLPQRMRYDLNRIFTDFTEVAGLAGGIAFQAQGQFVDVPLPRIGEQHDGGVVV